MALITCPECGHSVSDTAESCPKCGYDISKANKDFKPVIVKLSEPSIKELRKIPMVIFSVLIVGCLILALFNWPLGLILMAAVIVIASIVLYATAIRHQQGACPYCGTTLNFDVGSSKKFKCPKCGNVGKRNEKTIESIHE